jgi:ribonuclease Z
MFGWDMTQATWVATRIHTSPGAFGKVMSEVNPRLAVGYHSIQDIISTVAIADGVRETYDGALAIATDLMVINVTKDNITVRLAIVDENVNPPGAGTEYMEAKRAGKASPSEFINEGKWKDYTPPPMPEN